MSKKSTHQTPQILRGLDQQDYKNITKLVSLTARDIKEYVDECTEALLDMAFINKMLLCTLFEKKGLNPIDECPQLRHYLIYHHGSMRSDAPGSYVMHGKLYDAEDTEQPTKYFDAKEKGLKFYQVINDAFHETESANDQA